MSIDNYPDDIHSFDDCPSSPFYEEPPECEECGKALSITTEYDPELGTVLIGYCEVCK